MRPTLTINLPALRANYRLLKNRHAKHSIAAVVKANAYGLGVAAVAPALAEEGCEEFFVATLSEGIQLRAILPEAWIGVFNGLAPGEEKEYTAHRLVAVLNDVARIQDSGFRIQGNMIIHIDTGMTRLGLSATDLNKFLPRILNPESRILLMSHLASANSPDHPKNVEQLTRFKSALALVPGAKGSLCNSSGIFLPLEFHFDVARPGCALYGINPTSGKNPMQHVATLSAPLLQIRTLDRDETVGYGATYSAKKGSRIAIAALGYADGLFRSLGNVGAAYVEGYKVPIIGRVSMDMAALDVSIIPEAKLHPSSRAEFINAQYTVDDVASACGTIGYEIFTRIGARVRREYRNAEA